ncbi:C6 transcription factor [Pseudohyphozyma bogoriensis]|nr:C6 transcription factor [Pseudohyphozyma bogoriensis]
MAVSPAGAVKSSEGLSQPSTGSSNDLVTTEPTGDTPPWLDLLPSLASLGPGLEAFPGETADAFRDATMLLDTIDGPGFDVGPFNPFGFDSFENLDFSSLLRPPSRPRSPLSFALSTVATVPHPAPPLVPPLSLIAPQSIKTVVPSSAFSDSALYVASADFEFTKGFLLSHYRTSLAELVAIPGSSSSSSPPSSSNPSSNNLFLSLIPPAEKCPLLMLGILAWSAANLGARGPGNEAMKHLADQLVAVADEKLAEAFKKETEGATDIQWEPILAGVLMLVQTAICQGDVETWRLRLMQAALLVNRTGVIPTHMPRSSLAKQLLRNLLYHDVLSSSAQKEGPLLDYTTVQSERSSQRARLNEARGEGEEEEELDVLMGVAEPVFILIGRVTNLAWKKRSAMSGSGGGSVDDEALERFVEDLEKVRTELDGEKNELETLLQSRPDLDAHRCFHEVFCTAAYIFVNMMMEMPPTTLQILTLTARIIDEALPGLPSMHWVLFILQLNSTPLIAKGQPETDRQRCCRLYETFRRKHSFSNLERSRTVVEEVWRRNPDGRKFIAPETVLEEWNWCLNYA